MNGRKIRDKLGTYVMRIREFFQTLFDRYDLLVLPTTPIVVEPFDAVTLRWEKR